MKRAGQLFERIVSFENLTLAAARARRGKRMRPDAAVFHYDVERNLLDLRDELRSGSYQPGGFRTFRIRDPKPRLISAAPYRDRVAHHALCNVIEPVFERTFIHRSYANRTGKGAHAALDECTRLARKHPYVLKCDIRQYFPSIDHAILLTQVERKVKCSRTLALVRTIVEASGAQAGEESWFPGDDLFSPLNRPRGLPIGNLTSQLFGNVYLYGFDHFLCEDLRRGEYVRFVDDFLIFGETRSELQELIPSLDHQMAGLRLTLHPRKCVVIPTRCGVPFLGWRVYPDHRRLRRSTGVRIQRALRALALSYARGEASHGRVRASVMSWIGHLKHGDTWGLRSALLERATFFRETCRG